MPRPATSSCDWCTEAPGWSRVLNPVLDLLIDLREISTTPGRGCTRIAYTHFEDLAHDRVWDRFDPEAFERHYDAAGNLFVVPRGAAARGEPLVLVGSHLDTVIEGGWLDGALGVAVAVQVVKECATRGAGRPLGLVVFRDEEGVRFRTGLFGSKVFAGLCTEADLAATDDQGARVRDVVPDPEGCLVYRPPVTPAAYLECHIEQGMRLIESGRRVGVVTGMVGIRRLEVTAEGAANHAGTTEMHRRLDALLPIAALVARLPALVGGRPDTVATCGRIAAHPGAPNIVPGKASATVELRAPDAEALAALTNGLERLLASLAPPTPDTRLAPVRLRAVTDVAPTSTDPALRELLESELADRNLPYDRLPSMAGHDAQHAARICPAGMFFIPSLGGISHSPEENSREEDIVLAGELMLAWAQQVRQLDTESPTTHHR